MPTLREVLSKNINKYIKIGGKAGFFFAGYIHEDYEDLIKDLIQLEYSRLEKQRIRHENNLIDLERFWNERFDKFSNDESALSRMKIEKDFQVSDTKKKIQNYEKDKECITKLLDLNIEEQYRSFIDHSLILIVPCNIVASIDNREIMYKRPEYSKLANKYKV